MRYIPDALSGTMLGPIYRGAVAALGLFVAQTSPRHAQVAPTLGTDLPSFAVLGASTVTNTGPSVLTGNLGVSPGSAITGFYPSGPGSFSGAIYTATDAQALQAHTALNTAILALAGNTATQDLT